MNDRSNTFIFISSPPFVCKIYSILINREYAVSSFCSIKKEPDYKNIIEKKVAVKKKLRKVEISRHIAFLNYNMLKFHKNREKLRWLKIFP